MNAELDGLLGQLGSEHPRQREDAAEAIGDWLERANLAQSDTERVAAALVAAALREPDTNAREAHLHALTRSYRQQLPLVLVRPLGGLLPRLDLEQPLDLEQLDYCLSILAATHDPAAEAVITPFIDHPDPAVRACAKEALTELRPSN